MVRNQFLPEPLEPCRQPFGFEGLKRNSVNSRSAVVLLGQPIGFAQRLQLADMHVQSPKPPGRFSLRLAVYPPPQFLQTDGCLYHLTPASPLGRRKHRQQGPFARRHCSASSLLRTLPSPSPLRPTSRFSRLYGLPAPPFSRREEEGFSSCSARPCHRAAATTPSKSSVGICQLATLDAVFTLGRRIRPSRFPLFGATRAFAYAAARRLAVVLLTTQ